MDCEVVINVFDVFCDDNGILIDLVDDIYMVEMSIDVVNSFIVMVWIVFIVDG